MIIFFVGFWFVCNYLFWKGEMDHVHFEYEIFALYSKNIVEFYADKVAIELKIHRIPFDTNLIAFDRLNDK